MPEPFGTFYRRREPRGDAGDCVVLVGGAMVGDSESTPTGALIVQSATFGAVPDGWDSVTVPFAIDEFVQEYTEMSDAERGIIGVEQALAAQAETEKLQADPDRLSPWAYIAPVERRQKTRNR